LCQSGGTALGVGFPGGADCETSWQLFRKLYPDNLTNQRFSGIVAPSGYR
jgi:hypothetical protein